MTTAIASPDRQHLITRQAFDIRILAAGRDITATLPIESVKYNADGTGERRLKDGNVVAARWRFLNEAKTQLEVRGPDGTSRWVIVELDESIYRKVNIDTGIEFIHIPRQ